MWHLHRLRTQARADFRWVDFFASSKQTPNPNPKPKGFSIVAFVLLLPYFVPTFSHYKECSILSLSFAFLRTQEDSMFMADTVFALIVLLANCWGGGTSIYSIFCFFVPVVM